MWDRRHLIIQHRAEVALLEAAEDVLDALGSGKRAVAELRRLRRLREARHIVRGVPAIDALSSVHSHSIRIAAVLGLLAWQSVRTWALDHLALRGRRNMWVLVPGRKSFAAETLVPVLDAHHIAIRKAEDTALRGAPFQRVLVRGMRSGRVENACSIAAIDVASDVL